MEALTYRGRIYELTVVGDTANDELALECWDLSPSGGLLFTLVRTHEDLLLRPVGPKIPVGLLEESRPLQEPSWASSDPDPTVYSSGALIVTLVAMVAVIPMGVALRRQWALPTPTTEFHSWPRGGKGQCFDVACLREGGLGAFKTGPSGHYSIRPLEPGGLEAWLGSRAAGTEVESPFTQFLQSIAETIWIR